MNVYDFDGTIYDGDSTLDFYFFCIKHNPRVLCMLPKQLKGLILYLLCRIDKTRFKEYFYTFLQNIANVDDLLNFFWKLNKKKIKRWYLLQRSENDVIISASPEFLLKPICSCLNVKYLLASIVDKSTGKFNGDNCEGEAKVRRFKERFFNMKIDAFYSDSLKDTPLARLAQKSYLIKEDKIHEWNL